MSKTAIFTLILAGFLLAGVSYFYKNPSSLGSIYAFVAKNEWMPDNLRLTLMDMLRNTNEAAYDLRTQALKKEGDFLPVLKIYMSDAALKKINHKREAVLTKPRPILISGDDDWVNATIIYDDGKESKKVKSSLRLKGDWGDHLEEPSKLSFRVKVKGSDYVFGMKKFSIQHPKTRNYHYENMILDMMREFGILAPRYFFVDVRINDYKIGIMAFEEHFSKELLESQNRREGPILALDEDALWKQRDLNYNISKLSMEKDQVDPIWVHYIFNDFIVKEFKPSKYREGTIFTNNTIRSQSLLRDYIDDKLGPEEVFDFHLTSMWWIITKIWQGHHGLDNTNRRFYFNPTTNLLEPVAFDNIPMSYHREEDDSIYFFNLVSNEDFFQSLLKNLEIVRKALWSTEYKDAFLKQQEKLLKVLAIDHMDYQPMQIEILQSNFNKFIKYLTKNIERFKREDHKTLKLGFDDPINVRYKKLLELNVPLHSHIRAFTFIKEGKIELEIKNQTLVPIEVKRVYFIDKKGHKEIIPLEPFTIPVYKKGTKEHIISKEIEKPEVYPNKRELIIEYAYKEKAYTQTSRLQFKDHDFGFDEHFVENSAEISKEILVDQRNKSIIFPEGNYTIEKSYMLPQGYGVTFMPGVHVTLKNGALFKIRGAFNALGTKEKPIHVNIQTNTTYKKMGSWGGIYVMKSEQKSLVKYAAFTGDSITNLKNRQDYYGITGCVSFYESDVEVQNSHFNDLQCEDALNIVRSNFLLDQIHIKGARADAFDSDFSKGTIINSKFSAIGNDGIDVSGTSIEADNILFEAIGDKAISVGEQSNIHAKHLHINGASTGIASKDLSQAVIEDSVLDKIRGTGLITFIKKQEYGPASITCNACEIKAANYQATNQYQSSIVLNNQEIKYSDFTHDQMVEAGYVEE